METTDECAVNLHNGELDDPYLMDQESLTSLSRLIIKDDFQFASKKEKEKV